MDAFSLLYSKLFFLRNCVYLYLLPILLHRIGNSLAYVAALFVTSVCRLIRARGRAGQGLRFYISRMLLRILYVAKLTNSMVISFHLIELRHFVTNKFR